MTMANICFVETDSQLASDRTPITVDVFETERVDKKLMKWWYLAPGYGYDPYLVRFVSQNGDILKFVFIGCENGKDVGQEHTISVQDHELVHSESPSNLPSTDDYGAKRVIGFLMLNPKALDRAGLKDDAAAAMTGVQTASGKWPGTASEPTKFFMLLEEHAELQARYQQARARAAQYEDLLLELKQAEASDASLKARIHKLMSGS
jgi:hypothetical protein